MLGFRENAGCLGFFVGGGFVLGFLVVVVLGFLGLHFCLFCFGLGVLQLCRAGHAAVEIFGLNTFFCSGGKRGHAPISSFTLARELRKIHLKRL